MSLFEAKVAGDLCASCGLCCSGVLFHNVRLQPGDSPQDFVHLGLRVKRRKGGHFLLQPCPAHQGSQCAIYDSRPTRCRQFACRQLRLVASGAITETDAREKIQSVLEQVRHLQELLALAGKTDASRPLSKRYEKIMAEPAFDDDARALQVNLTLSMERLDAVLDADFRWPLDDTSLENP